MLNMLKALLQPMNTRLVALKAAPATPLLANTKSAAPAEEVKESVYVPRDSAYFENFAQVAFGRPPDVLPFEDATPESCQCSPQAPQVQEEVRKQTGKIFFCCFGCCCF